MRKRAFPRFVPFRVILGLVSQAADPRMVPLRDSLAGLVLRGTGGTTYHLRECIGEGGQGWVFRANWDDPEGHVVIVKVLRPDIIAVEALRRFEREASVLRMLSTQGRPNPYIVRFYDHAVAQVPSPFGPEPLTLPFTVLEYVNGTTLEKVLSSTKSRGLPIERVRRLLRQISQALDVVHSQKVVHRDLKPSNILLANEAGTEIAKVTDFGLVKLVDVNLQKTTALAGASLGYAPPEQYEQGNQRVGPRTDIFSLAAVAFEMLTGKMAFPFNDGENPLLIVTRILTAARPSIMKHKATLPPELEALPVVIESIDRELQKALSADPNARHESAMAFWNALEPLFLAAGGDKSSVGPPPKSKVSPWEATAPLPPKPSGLQARVTPTPSRPPESVVGNPTAWTWTLLTTPLAPSTMRAVAWSENGDTAVGIGSSSVFVWRSGAWVPNALPAGIRGPSVRGIRTMRDGSALVFGENGLVARVVPGAAAQVWRVPDTEITFLGGLVEDNGITTLVGERPYRGQVRSVQGGTAGVVAQFNGDRVTVIGDAVHSARLRGVARLVDGQLLACGDWGSIVRMEMGVVEQVGAICNGHLHSIMPLAEGGALTVGVGGHALSLSPKFDAQLEAVQTTRDLLALDISADGQAWVGSAQCRLLRRSHGSWVRMTGDLGVATSSIIAIWAGPRWVRAIGDDGVVVEGRLT